MAQTIKITPEIQKLIQVYQNSDAQIAPKDEERIKVDQIVSKLAFAYEKLRNAVEYHEEHLLLRHAIHRILKRRLAKGTGGKEQPNDKGLWTSPKVADWIEQATGTRPTNQTGLNYLRELGFTLQQPRPVNIKAATDEEVKSFKKN